MRPTIDEYLMMIAKVVSVRTTCRRRAVGAVIANASNHILSTGFNGVPSGVTHCLDVPCIGADFPSGEGLDICKAQHAEVNAIAHCRDLNNAFSIYVTTSPCMSCMKLIAATNIQRVVYQDKYDDASLEYFLHIGREIKQISLP
jgi:dCMP deaminase